MDTHLEMKTARMTLLLDPGKKRALEVYCAQHDLTPSQLVRGLIRDFLKEKGVHWTPAGAIDNAVAAETGAEAPTR
jgi:hypothetical protein